MTLQTTSLACLHSSFRHYYLSRYLPLSTGKDSISRSLLKFKHRNRPDFNTWIESALEALKEIALTPDTIIVRALHHQETIAGTPFPTALDFLGHAIAGRFKCRYLPTLLHKSRPAQPCKELSRRQRKTELSGIYSLSPTAPQIIAALPRSNDPSVLPTTTLSANAVIPASPIGPITPSGAGAGNPPPFLLIDDILTTGTTMRMIIRSLRRSFPNSSIRIFTLARADYTPGPIPISTQQPDPYQANPSQQPDPPLDTTLAASITQPGPGHLNR